MHDPALQSGRLHARRVLLSQLLLGGLIAAVALLVTGRDAAIAAIIGMVAVVLPGWHFARRALGTAPGAEPRRRAAALYKGEIGKWLLTVALFVVAVREVPQHMLVLMTTYIVCMALQWVMLAIRR